MIYDKKPLSKEKHVELLQERGLKIEDKKEVILFLNYVNYYRLSVYFIPFQIDRECFYEGVTFSKVCDLYCFDKAFRTLLTESLATIEISVRTKLTEVLTLKTSNPFPHWRQEVFREKFWEGEYNPWLKKHTKEAKRSKEIFIEHFKAKYSEEFPKLPLWAAVEIMSLGSLSLLIKGLKSSYSKHISSSFSLPDDVFRSWMHTLAYVRNLCAHHARVWNRHLVIEPKYFKNGSDWGNLNTRRIFYVLLMIKYLLTEKDAGDNITKKFFEEWRKKIIPLIKDSFPMEEIRLRDMGFPENWESLF